MSEIRKKAGIADSAAAAGVSSEDRGAEFAPSDREYAARRAGMAGGIRHGWAPAGERGRQIGRAHV